MALHPERERFITAAQAHMAKHGDKNWKMLFEQFPDVHEQSMWRWIRAVKKLPPSPSAISNARERLVASVKKFPQTTRAQRIAKDKLDADAEGIVDYLPAGPSPAYITQAGDEGLRTIDFVAEIQTLYSDGKMLRAYAMKTKRDQVTGEEIEVINNPNAFDKSIMRRANLLETAIRAVQEVWDLRTMQNFYETIIDEIGKESPEAQRRIMERLALLNQRSGMTLGAMRV